MRARRVPSARLRPSDPRLRLGVGVAGLALAAAAVRPDRISPNEKRVFAAINRLPDSLGGPLWLGAVTPIGGVLFLAGWATLAWSLRTLEV